MTSLRDRVLEKSGGHCWYCGDYIAEKAWHMDHFIAKRRYSGSDPDCIENRVPSCAPCNLFKSVYSLEDFRQEISKQTERANKSVNFRTAKRFGLIEIIDKPVVFWFEAQDK